MSRSQNAAPGILFVLNSLNAARGGSRLGMNQDASTTHGGVGESSSLARADGVRRRGTWGAELDEDDMRVVGDAVRKRERRGVLSALASIGREVDLSG